mmetsp:Transcript_17650/g.43101  ORF Transcript_17650/g.43101 Transcript_17650/m.43101 type:complete len:654 (-) Transcript_17650:634-2595(-)
MIMVITVETSSSLLMLLLMIGSVALLLPTMRTTTRTMDRTCGGEIWSRLQLTSSRPRWRRMRGGENLQTHHPYHHYRRPRDLQDTFEGNDDAAEEADDDGYNDATTHGIERGMGTENRLATSRHHHPRHRHRYRHGHHLQQDCHHRQRQQRLHHSQRQDHQRWRRQEYNYPSQEPVSDSHLRLQQFEDLREEEKKALQVRRGAEPRLQSHAQLDRRPMPRLDTSRSIDKENGYAARYRLPQQPPVSPRQPFRGAHDDDLGDHLEDQIRPRRLQEAQRRRYREREERFFEQRRRDQMPNGPELRGTFPITEEDVRKSTEFVTPSEILEAFGEPLKERQRDFEGLLHRTPEWIQDPEHPGEFYRNPDAPKSAPPLTVQEMDKGRLIPVTDKNGNFYYGPGGERMYARPLRNPATATESTPRIDGVPVEYLYDPERLMPRRFWTAQEERAIDREIREIKASGLVRSFNSLKESTGILNLKQYNVFLQSFAHIKAWRVSMEILYDMRSKAVRPDTKTIWGLLYGLDKSYHWQKALQIFDRARQEGVGITNDMIRLILRGCSRDNAMGTIRRLLSYYKDPGDEDLEKKRNERRRYKADLARLPPRQRVSKLYLDKIRRKEEQRKKRLVNKASNDSQMRANENLTGNNYLCPPERNDVY